MSRVHIIGGGFSGLAVGYHLTKLGVAVDIFEKSDRLGGLIESRPRTWGLVETAANGLLNNDRIEALFADLGVSMARRPLTQGRRAKRYIYRGRPKTWPLSPMETARLLGGLPVLATPHRGVRVGEPLETWAKRVLGESAFRYLVGPALQGIYGTTDLDAALVFKNFKWPDPFGVRPEMRGTVAPRGGMTELIEGLRRRIVERGGEIHLGASGDVRLSHPTVVATSAASAALLLLESAPEAARALMRIEYLPLTTVTVEVALSQSRYPGFGCLFPREEGFQSLGVLFNNFIFSERAQRSTETWILPFASEDQAAHRKAALAVVQKDREKLMGERVDFLHEEVTAWPHALPHFNAALGVVANGLPLPPRLYLTGNYLGSIGLAKIFDRSFDLATKIKSELK